ncbi:MAG: alpha/beta hydrolase family protein [Nevskiaceae bacterium]
MRLTRSLSLASLAALAVVLTAPAVPATQTATPPPPIEAFGTTPVIDNVSLSTDGRFLASSYTGQKVSIVILDRNVKKLTQRIEFDQTLKLRSMGFISPTLIIADFSITYTERGDEEQKSEIGAVFAISALDGSSRQLLEAKTNSRILPSSGRFINRVGAAPGEILMSASVLDNAAAGAAASNGVNSVLSVDPLTGKWRIIEKGIRNTGSWMIDTEGKIRARVDFYRKDQRQELKVKRGDEWETVFEHTDPDFSIVGLGADNQSALALGASGGERERLWSIPFSGGGKQPLYQDPKHDVEGTVRDIYDRTLKGVRLGGLEQRVEWLDSTAAARVRAIEGALPGRRIEIFGYTPDGKLVLAYAVSRNHPGAYYLVDFNTNRAELVGQEYPQLAKVPLGKVSNITYPARDGYPVPAYLTMPAGREAKGLPLVVLPHGGPRARDSGVGFDWWSQFVASRGYVVLQPQFRGSTGFGQKHELAGYRQWGQLMQHDVTDGVKHLIDQGIVDADRVCIAGASYGGYAALAGAAFTPDLYRCAVSVAGVSDLVEMLRWEENRYGVESGVVKFWRKHIGKTSDPDVAEFSPARSADKVTGTVLMMHGVDDTVVPYVQTEFMETAMKRAKTKHEIFQLKSEDHWLSRSPSRIEMLSQLDRFLDQHIGKGFKVTTEETVASR